MHRTFDGASVEYVQTKLSALVISRRKEESIALAKATLQRQGTAAQAGDGRGRQATGDKPVNGASDAADVTVIGRLSAGNGAWPGQSHLCGVNVAAKAAACSLR